MTSLLYCALFLSQTTSPSPFPRLVAQIHEDPGANLQAQHPQNHQHSSAVFHSAVTVVNGVGRTGSPPYPSACSQDSSQLIAPSSDRAHADCGDGGGGDSKKNNECTGGYRQVGTGRSMHMKGSPESPIAGPTLRDSPAAIVGESAARAAKELWRLWPEVVSAGINTFQEEVRNARGGIGFRVWEVWGYRNVQGRPFWVCCRSAVLFSWWPCSLRSARGWGRRGLVENISLSCQVFTEQVCLYCGIC